MRPSDDAPLGPQTAARGPTATLVRGLTARDGVLITVGSVLGTGIFLTTGDIARVLPHAGLILLVWFVGGLLTLTGALTYAELGALFPRAGGQYQFLREAYGPLAGFLFGWTAFTVIQGGGIATLAVGFGEYLGAFVPFFSTGRVLARLSLGGAEWTINGGQLGGVMAILSLTAINYVGLREGTGVQNVVTLAKIGSLVGLGLLGLLAPAPVRPDLLAAPPAGAWPVAFGLGMIAVLWSFDGWYATTNMAGEMRRPERDLPRALVGGTALVTLLYLLVNLVYVRTLPVQAMGGTERIGEAVAGALFGDVGARLVTAAVLVSTFGCISSTILYAARIYLPMAQDGIFFRSLARVHPRHRTPSASILAQGLWAAALTFSGTYEQLYTYVMFAVVLFHAATGAAVFVLRRARPDAPRPYRVWGYPWVPGVFVASSLALLANTLAERPVESLLGVLIMGLGLPAYAFWRRAAAPPAVSAA
jgi:APA family basic amino acid/polyamine antiporter